MNSIRNKRMKKTPLRALALLLSMGLGLSMVSCGSDDTGSFSGDFTNLTGFRVLASNPNYGDENVSTTANIEVKFSNSVDRGSLPGNVKVYETVGAQKAEITTVMGVSSTDNDTLLVFSPKRSLATQGTYEIVLSSGVRSLTGESLRSTTVLFFTGQRNELGFGTNSQPGAPYVTDLSPYQDIANQIALGFVVSFNESLVRAPRVWALAEADYWFYEPDLFNGPMQAGPLYGDDWSIWTLTFSAPPYVLCQVYNEASLKLTIEVREAIDTSGQNISRTHSEVFRNFLGFGNLQKPYFCP